MATYVNDLRLTEIATGDETGDWGDITNTNLELVAEAFSFGTEAITTNADTHTTTIADGATDPGRSIFLKYTGTLDSACTITIGPNTVSKLWLIENGTSGSQNIIISSGSGANITIPPGDTKAVYSDGAGSGAAMVDAFASLSVVDLKVQDDLTVTDDLIVNGDIDLEGSIDVNGTANLDVVDIDGAVDMASTLTVGGVIQPASANSIDLGTNGNEFRTLYLDTSIIASNALSIATGTNLTLDVAGELTFDADGGNITLKDGGTAIGQFQLNDTNHLKLVAKVSDADIFLQGNDGGSTITALRLDMSAAGAATFNSTIASGKVAITGGTATSEQSHATFTNTQGAKTYAVGAGQSGVTNNGFVIRNVTDNNFPLVISDAGAVDMASTLTVGGGVTVKNGATSAGFVEFFEDSDNGTNKVTLIGPASTADVTLTLPASAGTIATTASAADDATALAIALG